MSPMWETKPRTTPQKISLLLMGPEQVTRPKKHFKQYDDDNDDDSDDYDEHCLPG